MEILTETEPQPSVVDSRDHEARLSRWKVWLNKNYRELKSARINDVPALARIGSVAFITRLDEGGRESVKLKIRRYLKRSVKRRR